MKKLFLIFLFLLFTVNGWCATYYVKNGGNDALDGLSDANAWETIAQVNAATFVAGDSVLFNRGDTWREQLIPDSGSANAYITYGAYGNGNKPKLLGSIDLSADTNWTDEGGNLWYATSAIQVGNIIFDNELSCGVKEDLKVELATQDEFWWDDPNDRVYVYSVGNPGTVHTKIECALSSTQHLIDGGGNETYIILENLDLRYSGSHAIQFLNCSNIIIRGNDISYIGGGYQTETIRWGNGIEFWDNASNILVEKNRIDNIYDAGVTNQSNVAGTVQNNITYQNNIISNCEYTYETFLNNAIGTLSNISFVLNTCLYAGSGWGHAQRSIANGRHIITTGNQIVPSNWKIENNIFYEATESYIRTGGGNPQPYYLFDYNVIKQTGDFCLKGVTTYTTFNDYQIGMGQDLHSIALDPLLTDTYKLQKGSPCIDAGVIIDNVAEDYWGNMRFSGASSDIGAYEDIEGLGGELRGRMRGRMK